MTDQQIEIGIFGGTGIYDSGLLENSKEITIETPYGKTINNHPDVIDISQVIFRDLGTDAESNSYEIDEPGGLPHNKTPRYMIEIVSFTYFSNRVFANA